jgi:hypothetical protein
MCIGAKKKLGATYFENSNLNWLVYGNQRLVYGNQRLVLE